MNGKEVGKLLNKYDNGTLLSDDELEHLRDGLEMLVDFFTETKVAPLRCHYSLELYTVNSSVEIRKVNLRKGQFIASRGVK